MILQAFPDFVTISNNSHKSLHFLQELCVHFKSQLTAEFKSLNF